MSKIKLEELLENLVAVKVYWNAKYGCPVFKVGDKYWVPMTGEYGGYYEQSTEVAPPQEAQE